MRRTRMLILSATCITFLTTQLFGAQRTFVSAANGSDSNGCTRALPCRNFMAAIPLTDPDGEVVVLDSGGYGVVTITQPISLISPNGVYAGITAFTGAAVTVNAGVANVTLRNLAVHGQGAAIGVDADTVQSLHIENCAIDGFSQQGILFDPSTVSSWLFVNDTVVARIGNTGIDVVGTNKHASLNGVRVLQSYTQVWVEAGAQAAIRNSLASGGHYGFGVYTNSRLTAERAVATDNAYGFYAAENGSMVLTRCAATLNSNHGILAFNVATNPSANIWVSDSTITGNIVGVEASPGSNVYTRGNNTLISNATDGSFTSSVGAQ